MLKHIHMSQMFCYEMSCHEKCKLFKLLIFRHQFCIAGGGILCFCRFKSVYLKIFFFQVRTFNCKQILLEQNILAYCISFCRAFREGKCHSSTFPVQFPISTQRSNWLFGSILGITDDCLKNVIFLLSVYPSLWTHRMIYMIEHVHPPNIFCDDRKGRFAEGQKYLRGLKQGPKNMHIFLLSGVSRSCFSICISEMYSLGVSALAQSIPNVSDSQFCTLLHLLDVRGNNKREEQIAKSLLLTVKQKHDITVILATKDLKSNKSHVPL